MFRHRTLVWRAVAFWTPKRWVSVKVWVFCLSALFVFQTPTERIKDHYFVQTCCVIMGLHSTPAQTIVIYSPILNRPDCVHFLFFVVVVLCFVFCGCSCLLGGSFATRLNELALLVGYIWLITKIWRERERSQFV